MGLALQLQEAIGSVAAKHRVDVVALIDHLKTSTYQGELGYFVNNGGGTVKAILSRCPIEATDRRLQWLLKKYVGVIAKELGFKSGTYSPGGYRSMKNDPLRKDSHGVGLNTSSRLSFDR
jgi:hypothetical protein